MLNSIHVNCQIQDCKLIEGRNYLIYQLNNSRENAYINVIDFKSDTAFVTSFYMKIDSIQFLYTYDFNDLDTLFNYDTSFIKDMNKAEKNKYTVLLNNPKIIYDITNKEKIILESKNFTYKDGTILIKTVQTYYNKQIFWLRSQEINPGSDEFPSNMFYQKGFGFICDIEWSYYSNRYEFNYQLVNLNGKYINLDDLLMLINEDVKN